MAVLTSNRRDEQATDEDPAEWRVTCRLFCGQQAIVSVISVILAIIADENSDIGDRAAEYEPWLKRSTERLTCQNWLLLKPAGHGDHLQSSCSFLRPLNHGHWRKRLTS